MIDATIASCAKAVLFRNADWTLSGEGLEHRTTGYFIGRDVLAARRAEGLWDWPLQMAEKSWCRPSLFREAFLTALDAFGIARDAGLSQAFALGFGFRAGQAPQADGFVALADLLRPQPAPRPVPVPARRPARVSAGA
ncbi:hypothetical protein FV232_16995 [Methylobacterium sp. WL30]|uniref:hypothetical protein n=3 Tax=Methylobacterium TaxID=407 RepID=UPI0011C83847|nr:MULTISPECIES: hypothetical protein [unclassified Methylobacterium]MCJ2009612.1 hypothetical protein [Methylobacterium sp. J-092]MCJ2040373.1 hypothetical protein [Methylobacterium sp. J-059]MCJ2075095.1 hypothetical protein [Methylobacterium sp. E-016]TXN50449.1 hypothetical protein FV227_11910 [Methylobacterium sp. WL119]TXN63276.1 hypothetical protein FV230_20385 [Methylobacterium sp. WL6]